ncbi:MAG: alpha/beta hydrolase family protein, partial [Terriglobia bacterium]
MLSRRSFLQTGGAGAALLNGMFRDLRANAAEPFFPARAAQKRDYWNDWSDYLAAEVHKARPRRVAELAAIRTPAELRSRQASVRARVWRLIGGPIEKTPLNATIVGSLQQNTYKVEKVIFQSQPGVFVTAHLYIPTAAQPPFCGIVSPPGHYWEGKSARDYQHLYQNLARKGYMVLAFDIFGEGERQQYLDARTGQSRYSYPTNEHDQAGRPLVLLGMSFAQYCVWDSVRAVDYLSSRPEVDPERIGCVGHSGGATLTMYLCALEPRIQVAVAVEGHFRNFAARRYDAPGSIDDAEQNLVGGLPARLDRADLLRAFAPKPLLMCYTAQDVTASPFYLAAVQEVFQEVGSAYS